MTHFSNKSTTPNPSQTVPQAGDQAFKHLSTHGAILIQTSQREHIPGMETVASTGLLAIITHCGGSPPAAEARHVGHTGAGAWLPDHLFFIESLAEQSPEATSTFQAWHTTSFCLSHLSSVKRSNAICHSTLSPQPKITKLSHIAEQG